jgi:alkanesulfonate monooxygenase SsuD/methylene tetrahydromethanopterin reductase-like flavin-dependent oxidoreductase (luciferase family)
MTGLQFGVFDHIEPVEGVPLNDLYRDRLEQVELMDAAGIYCYHLAEHHTPAVHSLAPSQNVFLAAASQRTVSMHLSPCVYVLPLHHPLRLIEEISMLDNLCDGRLEIGVGRGGVLEAFFWGQDSDPETNLARYEETLAVVLRGLSHDQLTFKGRFFDFDEVPMRLSPKQRPYPPLWYMRNPATAAEGGMNAIIVGTVDNLEANVVRYQRLWAQHHGEGALTAQAQEPKIGLVTHMVLASTDEEAIESARSAWTKYRWNLGTPRRLEAERRGLTQFLGRTDTGLGNLEETRPDRHWAVEERRDLDSAIEQAHIEQSVLEEQRQRRRHPGGIAAGIVAGTPDSIRPFMDEYMTTGANYFLLGVQFGDLTHEKAMQTLRLFSEEVMPDYKDREPLQPSIPA